MQYASDKNNQVTPEVCGVLAEFGGHFLFIVLIWEWFMPSTCAAYLSGVALPPPYSFPVTMFGWGMRLAIFGDLLAKFVGVSGHLQPKLGFVRMFWPFASVLRCLVLIWGGGGDEDNCFYFALVKHVNKNKIDRSIDGQV